MKRLVVTAAVAVPIGSFALLAAVYWLAFFESVRVTVVALRAPADVARGV